MAHTATSKDQGQDQDGYILNGQFNGAFKVPHNMYQHTPAESDAQIAARRAMSKRSSRSFAARIGRTRSRKMEVVGDAAKPGITIDTSFTRHRGNVPHQLYPQNNEGSRKNSGSIRKQGWFGLGRSDTKNRGLGITKGAPQPERQPENRGTSQYPAHWTNSTNEQTSDSSTKNPKTADSVTTGSKSWQEISPWDRPIPIGITVPSDSVTDFSPYRTGRSQSGSDATLATPSIIITPAAAIKSVWSPDTASDYTPARASSLYSRATYMPTSNSDIPPVPTLPADVQKLPAEKAGFDTQQGWNADFPSRTRTDTLESSDTAFEEEQDDMARKDRIMSTGTVFEEDDTPLREKKLRTLSVDTSTVPTPRRSQGWWNIITTPFVMSRGNSIWSQNGRHGDKTPGIPMVPAEYGTYRNSPPPSSTYPWSPTERSDSTREDSPLRYPPSMAASVTPPGIGGHSSSNEVNVAVFNGTTIQNSPAPRAPDTPNNGMVTSSHGAASATPEMTVARAQQPPNLSDQPATPPSVFRSAPTVAGATATGGVLMPAHLQDQQRPINVNIEIHDRRIATNNQPVPTSTQATTQPGYVVVVPPPSNIYNPPPSRHGSPQAVPVFPPPPTATSKDKKISHGNVSRVNSPALSVHKSESKASKPRRKMDKFMSPFALCRRKNRSKKEDKKKKKRSCWFFCCGCCILIAVLIAIIVPIVVVFTKKSNNNPTDPVSGSPGTDNSAPPKWLNLTDYPPMLTGPLTIAQPEAVEEESGCVAPTTLWSCALPKEQQKDISPNKPDQPNFKVQITFQNGSEADLSKAQPVRRAANPVSVGAYIRSLLRTRAAPSPSPGVPSVGEMKFLGQTTEKNSAPFEGETTPFFMSFQDPQATTASRLAKRADDPTNITLVIPPPSLNPDGTAAAANLLPFPSTQPLRLFNRGKAEEHYGFYTYFDRSIFLKSIESSTGRGGNPADTDGGSLRDAASLRCTFTQTRFLVQIWTRSQKTKPLLDSGAQDEADKASERPGTFPYPVTFTMDRHGGDVKKKNLFCYNMEDDTTIIDKADNKFFQFEDRAFGGNLVNGTQGRPNAKGPIDGGSGGCRCKWQNWLD